MASEAGVLDLDPSTVVKKMRLQPGRMFLVDTAQGRIVSDEEIKAELAAEHPYQEWLDAGLFHLDDLPRRRLRPHAASPGCAAPADLRLHLRGAQPAGRADGAHRRRAARLDGHRHPGRRAVAAAADALRLLPAAVRPGDQPAAGRHPRRGGDQPAGHRRPRGRPAQPERRLLSPDRAAAADPAQRRAVEADLRRPRPRDPRPQARPARRGHSLSVPGDPRRPGSARRRSTTSAPRCRRPSATARASSCCPTASPTSRWRRSRRC